MTHDDALALYDDLPAVPVEVMLGSWRGEEVWTEHPLNGLLERARWHGKRFESAEEVHPLVHTTRGGRKYSVHPAMMPLGPALRWPWLRAITSPFLMGMIRPFVQTTSATARLRCTEYRGVASATMVYDHLPILDVFRRIDDDTVMGAMDMRGMVRPYFFRLHRESSDGPGAVAGGG